MPGADLGTVSSIGSDETNHLPKKKLVKKLRSYAILFEWSMISLSLLNNARVMSGHDWVFLSALAILAPLIAWSIKTPVEK